jgi:hypothetical protein
MPPKLTEAPFLEILSTEVDLSRKLSTLVEFSSILTHIDFTGG